MKLLFYFGRAILAGALSVASLGAQTLAGSAAETPETVVLPPLLVEGEALQDDLVQPPFPAALAGAYLNAGKRVSRIDFDALPQIQTDNYRQAFSKTPGLLVSELSNSSLLSLAYRGIGDPHESQNLLVLKDGIPFVLDPIGYPTVYFAPPFETVDRLEFTRGGAALQFGPQPSGVLNYVTHMPSRDTAFTASTQHVIGSDALYTNFTSAEGTIGKFSWLVNYDYRSGDSFRTANSDFELAGGHSKLVYRPDADSSLLFAFDLYDADHGEPGGLSRTTGAGVVNVDQSPWTSTLLFDRVRLQRTWGSLTYERRLNEQGAHLLAQAWAGWVSRYSKRENGQGFGRLPTGNLTIGSGASAQSYTNSNTVTLHEYFTKGGEVRLRLPWGRDQQQQLAVGTTLTHVDSPLTNRVGLTRDADTGALFSDSDRETLYGAVFAENRFLWGRLALTPGVRLEYIDQSIVETLNLNKTLRPTPTALGNDDRTDTVALVGLGATYTVGEGTGAIELFANASEAYKPATYTDAVPLGGTDTVSENLEPGRVWNVEFGARGSQANFFWWEASLFYVDYRDRFGRVGSNLQNVGRSVNQGFDLSGELNLLRLFGDESPRALSLHANVQWLDAEFTEGPLDGRAPQYAPEWMGRAGLTWRSPGQLKLSVLATYLSEHFADDANTVTATADWRIPAYTVVDLMGEVYLLRRQVSLLFGLNNILDERYTSRIRSNGIDPANGRNAYGGLRFSW